ncbi:hypothetical protein GF420_04415 [candidate division GN15 bacterium]|nr:hypothetical protein [candidate division GN15 bacterium]
MPRCNHRRIFLVCAILIGVAVWGCEQADDISTGIANTDLYLAAERMPSTPPGMIYELWVASASDTISLGKFGYDAERLRFLDLGGNVRPDSNKFTVDDDIMAYSEMFVSIETATDPLPGSPGPIMLRDAVTMPGDNPIELIFPTKGDSLGNAVARYCLESTSDDNRDNDGSALWFANYRAVVDSTPDTTSVVVSADNQRRAFLVLDTLVDTVVDDTQTPPDTTFDTSLDSIFLAGNFQDTIPEEQVFVPVPWEVTNIRTDSVLRTFGPDTLTLGTDSVYHVFVRFDIVEIIDSVPPYEFRTFRFNYDGIVPKTVNLDIFSQDDFDLPDYSDMGWRYKGWVLTPYLSDQVPTRVTLPAWYTVEALQRYLPNADGALLTTGAFTDISQPDMSNPFAVGPKLPPFPGEDFLKTSELQATYGVTDVNLMPFGSGNEGTVFITLEPENYVSDSTNFPLFVLVGELPSDRSVITADLVSITLQNGTRTAPVGDLIGFPKITVSMERF